MSNKKNPINKIYEDDYILVLNKPAGCLTIPDRYDKSAINLYGILTEMYPKIFTVHRLDKDTSGVIVFAKDAESHKNINQQFQEFKVTKIYHAVLSGNLNQNELVIDIPITEDLNRKGYMKPSARGKESLTVLNVIERFRNATLVELNLVTGRHHQIRVHCASIGYPLLVDELYGKSKEFYVSSLKRKYNIKKGEFEKPIISRVSMHAKLITFLHPEFNEKVSYDADYPKDFSALLEVLKKYSNINFNPKV
ncbi:MAG: RluA family pseudouridine synthase [Bacteroidetes bacterium]|nr:MAG: RluA family pseudouridine synthase [Bacteroidota bacterium]